MMKKIITSMCMLFLLTASGCGPEKESDTYHKVIPVTNNSDKPIYIGAYWVWSNMSDEDIRPGGLYSNYKSASYVAPGQTNRTSLELIHRGSSFEGMLQRGTRLAVTFIDAEIYDRWVESGDETIPDGVWLDLRVYTLEDLQRMNFHIQYSSM